MALESGRKRKHEGLDEEEPSSKTSFKNLDASDVSSFIKSADGVEVVKQYFCSEECNDRITSYLKQGGSISEVLSVLNKVDTKKDLQSSSVVYQALQKLIITILREYPEKESFLEEECRSIVLEHSDTLMTLLRSKKSVTYHRASLQLMTALASASKSASKELIDRLYSNRRLVDHLVVPDESLQKNSIRNCYIQFMLALMIDQPPSIIAHLLTKKDLLVPIFCGLKYDNSTTAVLFLSTLKKTILENKEINRSLKSGLFYLSNVKHLLKVYAWDPNSLPGAGKRADKMIDPEEIKEVRSAVHELLLTLCTSVDHGLYLGASFKVYENKDKSSKRYNYVIFPLLKSMLKLFDDPLKIDLVTKITQTSPEAIKMVYSLVKPSFSKIELSEWPMMSTLVIRVIEGIEPNMKELGSIMCSKIANSLLAPTFLLNALSDKEFYSDVSVRNATVQAVLKLFKKVNSYVASYYAHFTSKTAFDNIKLIQHLLNNLGTLGEHLVEVLQKHNESLDINDQKDEVLSILHLLMECYKACPNLLDFLAGDKEHVIQDVIQKYSHEYSEMEDSLPDDPVIHEIIVRAVALNAMLKPSEPGSEEFSQSISLVCSCIELTPVDVTEEVLKGLFYSSGFFNWCPHELDIWMCALELYGSKTVSKLLSKVVLYASTNVQKLSAKLVELDAEQYSVLPTGRSSACSIDDFLKLCEFPEDNFLNFHSSESLNVSILFIALLKVAKKGTWLSRTKVQKFILYIAVNILHYQTKIESYQRMITKLGQDVVNEAIPYITSWGQNVISLESTPLAGSLVDLISKHILSGTSEDLLTMSKGSQRETRLCLQQILFSLCQLANEGLAGSARVSRATQLVCALSSTYKPSADPSQNLHVFLTSQALFSHFHPFLRMKNSNLTPVVLCLAQSSVISLPLSAQKVYSDRVKNELITSLQDPSVSKKCRTEVEEVFKLFPLSEEHVISVVEFLISENSSVIIPDQPEKVVNYFVHIFQQLRKFKINLNAEQLSRLINAFGSVVESSSKVLLDVFRAFLFDLIPSLSTEEKQKLGSACKNLLEKLLKTTSWHPDLVRVLLEISRDTFDVPLFLSELSFDKQVLVLGEKSLRHILSHFDVKLDTDDLDDLLLLFTCDSASEMMENLLNVVGSFFEPSLAKKFCLRAIKNKQSLYLGKEHLDALRELFIRADLQVQFYDLLLDWLNEYLKTSLEICSILCSNIVKLACHTLSTADSLDDFEEITSTESLGRPLSQDLTTNLILWGITSQSPSMLEALIVCIMSDKIDFTMEKVFELVTSHSKFISVLLDRSSPVRYQVIRLILVLIRTEKSLAKPVHVPLYLGAYNATLSKSDLALIKILRLYESYGYSLMTLKPLLWGPAAVSHYSLRNDITKKGKPPSKEIYSPARSLENLDLYKIESTITNFPVNSLMVEGSKDDDNVPDENVYDPMFVLRVISHVQDSCDLKSWQVTQSGALSFALAALSSKSNKVRLAALLVIKRFKSILNDQKVRDLKWKKFLLTLKQSLNNVGKKNDSSENGLLKVYCPRLSNLHAVFLARSVLVMMNPNHPAYKPIHGFFQAVSFIKPDVVPSFNQMFKSVALPNALDHQTWILEVLRDGVKEPLDVHIVMHSLVLKPILSFSSCVFASPDAKVIIFQIIDNMINIADKSNRLLINTNSILPWLSSTKEGTAMIKSLKFKNYGYHSALIEFWNGSIVDDLPSKVPFLNKR